MKQKGVTSVALAEALGVTKATVSYWLNGKVFPAPDILPRIADALGVELWELFRDPNKPIAGEGTLRCPHCGGSIHLHADK